MLPPLSVNKRSIGITFPTKECADVLIWAPLATKVAIHVHRSSGKIALKQDRLGYWCTRTDQICPGDLYTVQLNDKDEYPDPASLSQPQGLYGPSQAVDTSRFFWEDQSWVNPALEDYLIYEIHTGTFTPGSTFSHLEAKLDYLKSLGVTAIELMPIAQFADQRNWGYDGVFAFAAQNSYGGYAGLQHLVNICHYKGLAVILDVVYNHFGPEGNCLPQFGPYLTSKYCTPWGDAVNFDDAWCDGVRHYFIENALMWLRDFHIDALRLDAVHAIKDFSTVHILQELRQKVDQLMETTGRRHYLLVESDLNDPRFIKPLSEQGYGMDAQWMDEFHHALRVTAGEKKTGYYADFNGIAHLTKSYRDGYVYDGQFSEVRQRLFGSRAEGDSGHQFIVFSQNHDQVGNRMRGERSSQLFSFPMTKLLAGAVLMSPYIPLLFMGEEWGETAPFFYFAYHSEPELIEAVRQGRKEEFSHFHSNADEVPDPQDDVTFQKTKLQWQLIGQEPHQTMLRYYQTLIALRQQLPALRRLNRRQLDVVSYDDQQTLLLHRWHEDQHVVCLMNFSDQPQTITPTIDQASTDWQKLLDSADALWQPDHQPTDRSTPDTWSGMTPITLQPESIVIYALGHEKSHFNVPNPISQGLYLH